MGRDVAQGEVLATPRIACFVVRHTRVTLTGFGRFGLAYFRHTDKWFTVHRGLTAAECFREIEENEVFWPTT
jgi:uncharacterized protein (UPF0128 family)